MKRILFGDKFWSSKKAKKTKFPESFGDYSKKSEAFRSAKESIKETCLAILSDCYLAGRRVIEHKEREEFEKLAEQQRNSSQESKHEEENFNVEDKNKTTQQSDEKSRKSPYDCQSQRFDGASKIPLTTVQREKLEYIDKLTAEILKNEVGCVFIILLVYILNQHVYMLILYC